MLISDEGIVHGTVSRLLLGKQPSDIVAAGGCLGGFSVQNGRMVPNSYSCNASENYHDGKRDLNGTEYAGISKAIKWWRTGIADGQNISVASIIDAIKRDAKREAEKAKREAEIISDSLKSITITDVSALRP